MTTFFPFLIYHPENDDWIPCYLFIPPHDKEWGPLPLDAKEEILGYYSIEVLILTIDGEYSLGNATRYYDDDLLRWKTDGEGWDITKDVLCWKLLPKGPEQSILEMWKRNGIA